LILFDSDWNPAHDIQAMARVWRDGQKKNVHIYRFLAVGAIDEKIFMRQVEKQKLSLSVVDKQDGHSNTFTKEELHDLFTLNTQSLCETHELLRCNCFAENEQSRTAFDEALMRQLGHVPRAASKKNIKEKKMDELMTWKHYFSSTMAEVCLRLEKN
jgi:DNA repair and recombination protein RAD54B